MEEVFKKFTNMVEEAVLKEFINMVEEELSAKEIWMAEDERVKTAHVALHLFTNEDYSTASAAVEDAVARADGKIKNFEMKLTFREGELTVDYLDGADVEVKEVDSLDDILENVGDAIAAAVDPEEN